MSKLLSRKFILALAAQIAGLLALFFPDYGSDIANASVQVGGLLVMALAAFGYIQGEAKIDTESIAGKRQLEETKMRLAHDAAMVSRSSSPGIALLACLTLFSVGCKTSPGGFDADTPLGQYDMAQEAYIAVVSTLNTGRQAGAFDDAEWAKINLLIQQADGILDATEAAALADDSTVLNTYLVTLRTTLNKLKVWAIQAEEQSDESSVSSHDYPGGIVRLGYGHPGLQDQWQASRSEVSGGAKETPQGSGRAIGPDGEGSGQVASGSWGKRRSGGQWLRRRLAA